MLIFAAVACGFNRPARLFPTSGNISSPGFENNLAYPPGAYCVWQLDVNDNRVSTLPPYLLFFSRPIII